MSDSKNALCDFSPMEAATALYHADGKTADETIKSLSRFVFDTPDPAPSKRVKRVLARLTYRFLKRTTRVENGRHRNRFLERSGYPYALAVLHTSDEESASLVEGGDPMNAPYMMGLPEVRANATIWDRLFLDSVIGKDVRLRFIWETASTYESAKARLDAGGPVRLKAAAAGTGLSMVVAYDRLVRDGYGPDKITAVITDRAAENSAKTNRLLARLETTRDQVGNGISAHVEDLLATAPATEPFDVVTLIGILEYFEGTTATTTEELARKPPPDGGPCATALVKTAAAMLAPGGTLISNSFRLEPGGRLLEAFGKRFRYRTFAELESLAAQAGLEHTRLAGSAHIYDVGLFSKPVL